MQIKDRNGMGSALGDGDLDWFVTSIWSVLDESGEQRYTLGNRLYENTDGLLFDFNRRFVPPAESPKCL